MMNSICLILKKLIAHGMNGPHGALVQKHVEMEPGLEPEMNCNLLKMVEHHVMVQMKKIKLVT